MQVGTDPGTGGEVLTLRTQSFSEIRGINGSHRILSCYELIFMVNSPAGLRTGRSISASASDLLSLAKKVAVRFDFIIQFFS
jgi:hypothetical protein